MKVKDWWLGYIVTITRRLGRLRLLGFNTKGSMRNCFKPFFGYELSRFPANAIGAVFNSNYCELKVVNEFFLSAG